MISAAYTLLLISLVFGTVPGAWAAPVGTRNVHVKTMRRAPFEKEHMRRVHHSATSVVQRDDVHGAVAALGPAVTSTVASPAHAAPRVLVPVHNAPRSSESVPVVARHAGHQQSDTAIPETTRRHHAKNEARGGVRAVPRFHRDEAERRGVGKDQGKREDSASDANVTRESIVDVQTKTVEAQAKRESGTQEIREPVPQPTPVRPIVMFRRALALEDLD
ncbi:hypothetical protein C0993_001779 [Termitomyces sp. T159_Od127]|nr:hypothetical protein C0993_001779 [Termitomyces sp. T159_Od127]